MGVQCGTLYMLLGSTITDGCSSSIVPEGENAKDRELDVTGENIILWHQRLGHIGEKGLRELQDKGMVEGMSNLHIVFLMIFVNIIYMARRIE